jgi:hypothetical protein
MTVHLVMCGEKIIRAYWDARAAEENRRAEAAKAGDKEHWWIRDVPVIGDATIIATVANFS